MTWPEGIIPVLSMPFGSDERIDFDDLRAEVEFLLDAGVGGIAFGLGSEILRLTEREREQTLSAVVDLISGRVPVVASAGSDGTYATCARTQVALERGADLVMLTPPRGMTSLRGLRDHYATVGARTEAAIIVQDAPDMTGVQMPAAFLAELVATVDQVVAVKVEEVPSAPKISDVLRSLDTLDAAEAGVVLGGGGGLDFARELDRGAGGTLPGASRPEFFQRVWEQHHAGDARGAHELFNLGLPLLTLALRSPDTFLFVEKEILRRRGVLRSARLRAPGQMPDGLFLTELEAVLSDFEPNLTSAAVGGR